MLSRLTGSGNKNKKAKAKANEKERRKNQEDDDPDDVKEVLRLFNRLEELVVDGDPRVREAINQKPVIQSLLREDSLSQIGSPRYYAQQQQQQQQQPPQFSKEETQSSILSVGRNRPYNSYMYTQPQRFTIPLQTHAAQLLANARQPAAAANPPPQAAQARPAQSNRRQIVVPPIAIPERSFNLDENEGQLTGRVRRHPDGTLVATIDSVLPAPEPRPQPAPRLLLRQPLFSPQQRKAPAEPVAPKVAPKAAEKRAKEEPRDLPLEAYHTFNYNTGGGETSVRILLDDRDPRRRARARRTEEPPTEAADAENANPTGNPPAEPRYPQPTVITFDPDPVVAPSQAPTSFHYRSQAVKSKGTGSISKVIGPEGGRISYLGCSVDVPKNAVRTKFLFRLSILDVGQVPHTTDRLYQVPGDQKRPVWMALTPAVRLDPPTAELDRAVTVKLPTCIAVHGQAFDRGGAGASTDRSQADAFEIAGVAAPVKSNDIQTEDIAIKLRNSATGEAWSEHPTEVFRSADSVTFKMQQLGDVCAFHCERHKEMKALNKRLSVYIFKSSDNRKNQFLSMLLAEDLPHVIQKAVESVPHWLRYTDSCFNIILPEGRNFVVYIEPVDRSYCYTEANILEIPWQNLWYPECIIRKHVQVTLLNRNSSADVQLLLDEGNVRFTTSFTWQVETKTIQLPDVLNTPQESGDKWETELQEKSDPYKTVKWKPETPDPRIVTNAALLDYAQM